MHTPPRAVMGLVFFVLAICLTPNLAVKNAAANWLVEGNELGIGKAFATDLHTPLKLVVSGKSMEVSCSSVQSANLEIIEGPAAEGTLNFTNCSAISPIGSGKINKNCKPAEPIQMGINASQLTHNGQSYTLVKGSTPGYFGTVEFGELCALTETSEITGSIALECGQLVGEETFEPAECSSEKTDQLLRPNETLFTSNKLMFGENSAKLTGVGAATLTNLTENAPLTISSHTASIFTLFNLEIKCSAASSSGLKLLAASTTAQGALALSGCTAYSPVGSGKEAKQCIPAQPIGMAVKATLILHGGKNYILFASTGAILVVLKFSEECPLFGEMPVIGSFVAECGALSGGVFQKRGCETEEATQLLRLSGELFSGDGLKFGEQKIGFSGIWGAKLAGSLFGLRWGGHV